METTLSVEALMNLRALSNPAVSPDGSHVAVVVGAPAARLGERVRSELWWGPLGGELVPLKSEPNSRAAVPAFSADGSQLAFALAEDGGLPRAWTMQPDGIARKLAGPSGAVEALRWSDDGSFLVALIADPGSDSQGAGAGTRMAGGSQEPIVRRPRQAWRRLWILDAESEDPRPLTPTGVNIWEFGWQGTGPIAATASSDPSESGWYDADVVSIDIVTGNVDVVYRPQWQVQSPVIDPSGRWIAFVEGFASDRTCVAGTITVIDLGTREKTELSKALDAVQLDWLADGSIFWTAIVGLESSCGLAYIDGSSRELWKGSAMMGLSGPRAASSRGGETIVAVVDAPGSPHELRILDGAEKGWTAQTKFNARLANYRAPSVSRHEWAAPDGTTIEGLLLLPAGHDDGPLPLVVAIHGGPVGAHGYGFARPTELALANAGYAVLLPNPRGSAGRGQEFARAVKYDMGGAEIADTVAGVEYLRSAGVVDGDRIGITGFSHGGFISAWAPTQTNVFRAAVPRACVSNWISFHNSSNIGRWDELFVSPDPYDPHGHHFMRSPVVHASQSHAPTLVMHGQEDLSAPVGQAHELYQSLVEVGCETELVVYPRAGHGWIEREQLVDSCERIVAWFDRHLAP